MDEQAETTTQEPERIPQIGSRIQVEPSRILVRRTDERTARFICNHPEAGREQIQYRWSRADGQPISMRAVENGNYLDFDGLKAEDSGQYVCSTQSESGADSAFGELIVQGEGSVKLSI